MDEVPNIQDRSIIITIRLKATAILGDKEMYKIALLVTIFMTLGVVTTTNAKSTWKNPDRENQRYTQGGVKYDARIEVRFSNYDRERIYQYYRHGKRKKVPPGLAKKKHLPPGLQKQIRKNGKLPPGLQGRYLPYNLERALGRLPNDYVRIRVGADIVLIDVSTKLILDVIKDIAF